MPGAPTCFHGLGEPRGCATPVGLEAREQMSPRGTMCSTVRRIRTQVKGMGGRRGEKRDAGSSFPPEPPTRVQHRGGGGGRCLLPGEMLTGEAEGGRGRERPPLRTDGPCLPGLPVQPLSPP